jgi:flagellar M-ring protein FliF
MERLYTKEITAEDIDEIKKELNSMGYTEGVEFNIVKGEKTSFIMAERQLKSKMLSHLSDLGLPRGARQSFSTIKTGFSDTEADRQAAHLHALEGEIETSIVSMEGVINARVRVVLPDESLFEEDKQPAKATIMIDTKSGYNVTKSQIQGIINLVSGSVSRLAPENVKVVDQRGVTLSDLVTSEEDPLGMPTSSTQMQRQKEFDKELTDRAQSLLDRTIGVGDAAVEVKTSLNFNQSKTTMKVYGNAAGGGSGQMAVSSSNAETGANSGGGDQGYITIGGRTVGVNHAGGIQPAGGGDQVVASNSGVYVLSQAERTETYASNGKGNNGVAPSGGSTRGNGSDYISTDRQTNYVINERNVETIEAPGQVERITVALMLNNKPENQVNQIKDAVAASVGLDQSRGDLISVSNFPFKTSEYDIMRKEMLSAPAGERQSNTAGLPAVNKAVFAWAGAGVLAIMLIVFAMFLAKQKKSNKEKMQLHLTAGPGSSINPISDLLSDKSGRTVAPSSNNTTVSCDQLTRMAKEKPNKVAELLKTSWMSEK